MNGNKHSKDQQADSLDVSPEFASTIPDAPNPEGRATWLSRLTFWYLNSFLLLGYRKALEPADFGSIHPNDQSVKNYHLFEEEWQIQQKLPNGSAFRAIYKTIGKRWYLTVISYGIYIASSFYLPLILKVIVSYMQGASELSEFERYAAGVGCFAVPMVGSLAYNFHYQMTAHIGFQVRAALSHAIYRKSLRLNGAARASKTVGHIVNIMSADANQIQIVTNQINVLWSTPIQIGVALWLVYRQVGNAMFVGLGLLFSLFPVSGVVFKKIMGMRFKMMALADKRVKLTNELLTAIRVVKMYAWERAVRSRVFAVREGEIQILKYISYAVSAVLSLVMLGAPIFLPILVFVTYTRTGHDLDASTAFTTLSLFNLIRMPFAFLPMTIQQISTAKVALQRIESFLRSEEVSRSDIIEPSDPYIAVEANDLTCQWGAVKKEESSKKEQNSKGDSSQNETANAKPNGRSVKAEGSGETEMTTVSVSDEPFKLQNMSFKIAKGQLVAVVGSVGSGKSSLLSALLGELKSLGGTLQMSPSIAYAAQQPWIINASLRDNVLFDTAKPIDAERYRNTLRACALEADLQQLKDGDMTEIGERGINLSGGQKARVSLARAVYSDREVLVMDDVLSAVDPHVAEHIFQETLLKYSADRTRIVATNQLQFLSKCDWVIVLDQGRIVEQGRFQDLVQTDRAFSQLLSKHGLTHQEEEKKASILGLTSSPEAAKTKKTPAVTVSALESKAAEKLVTVEERETGEVDWAAYLWYSRACGTILLVLMFLGFAGTYAASLGQDFWLSDWSEASFKYGPDTDTDYYVNIYTAWACAGLGCTIFRSLVFSVARVRGSRGIHERLFDRILRAPMRFFDTTPVGRILNRFSRDIDTVDIPLSMTINPMFGNAFLVLSTVIGVIITTKGLFLVAVAPLCVVYFFVQRFFRRTSLEIQRLESISRSPIFAHFSETLVGITTIRAYRASDRFILKNQTHVDDNTRIGVMYQLVFSWLGLRLDLLGSLIAFTVAMTAVTRTNFIDNPGYAGLALSYAFNVTNSLKEMVRTSSEVESRMNSVERIKYYSEQVEQEAPAVIEDQRPPANWPDQGNIRINELTVSYKPGNPVLKSLSFDIKPREKLGIAGRTGSGKSTLMLALLRLCEPEAGQITIDGINTGSIGLEDLRKHIAIIPQDPVLFSDTVRRNLDPFDEQSDEEVWRVLELVNLKEYVTALPQGLLFEVAEGGENFSVGQRQMICMARALIRKPKILLLDEATASIDIESDFQVQLMIRKCFSDCTVLTIAHRLKTIMDSDRILVLDKGRIACLGKPSDLLSDPNSVLTAMVEAHGPTYAKTLRGLAYGEIDISAVKHIHQLEEEGVLDSS